MFYSFIFLFHMNWPIPSYSGGKLTIKMIRVHIVIQCHSDNHARISKKLGPIPSMLVDTFSVQFHMTVFG